ncbi:V-set domain-containing T-cell activation inhibitor 1 isoform X2 [Danio aesculapii]|uniref:V-set domain-containing T-cell activation inhibitor 1 isoform X2 n=1 Tax=Danio aesculapii TaxID=1142201 RepID=UPI0024C0696C|nr:V-set domain-containing T-cell activation inhibitor 1 isoform X2 [Danio aesculapii]
MLFFLLLWTLLRCADLFSITVPSDPVLAVRGATALLSCLFESDSDPSKLVITWQRVEDMRVVHSYYHLKDQLERQSADYINRTQLNYNEIAKGNASLSIATFGLKDAGKYECVVSNTKGTDKGTLQLNYAAIYSEPRLSIHLKSSNVTVQYETEGYPQPEVMWFNSGGQNLTNHQEISSASDEGLYYLKSSYVSQNPELNITFTLKNPAAHQELQRHLILNYENGLKRRKYPVSGSSVGANALLMPEENVQTGWS